MGTFTTQILIGQPHPYHDGISPSHVAFLSENDRPAWVLMPLRVFGAAKASQKRTIWIPTVEHMLEDGLLMIGIHVVRDRELTALAKSFHAEIDAESVELYAQLDEGQREELYEMCRRLQSYPKLILSLFRDSYVMRQLRVLEEYSMDIEVCTPVFSRLRSVWSPDVRIEGQLPEFPKRR